MSFRTHVVLLLGTWTNTRRFSEEAVVVCGLQDAAEQLDTAVNAL